MGCGESKHAVATADTISQTKRSNSKKTNNQDNPISIEKATDDVKTNTNASLEEQEKGKGANVIDTEGKNVINDSKGATVTKESENPKTEDVKESDHQENGETVVETVKENGNKEAEVVAEDRKEESEKKELKEESTDKSEKEEAGGGGPDSPHQFSSPKKGEETIVSDEVSGNSENNAPEAKKDPSENKTDVNDVVEEKGSTRETKSEEAITENEGIQTEQGEAATQTAETEEEKAPGAKEENAT